MAELLGISNKELRSLRGRDARAEGEGEGADERLYARPAEGLDGTRSQEHASLELSLPAPSTL